MRRAYPEKASGIINPLPLQGGNATFSGGVGNFAGETWGPAYWVVGNTIYGSSGGRILYDLRTELAATGADNAWSGTLIDSLIQRVQSMGPSYAVGSTSAPTRSAESLTRAVLRWSLWYTYHRVATAHIDAVRLPLELELPRLGQVMAPGAQTAMRTPFDLTRGDFGRAFEETAWNPATNTYESVALDVPRNPRDTLNAGAGGQTGTGAENGSGDSGGAFVALALALLALGGDK